MNEFANFRPDARTWAALLSTALRDEPVPETLSDAIRPLAALAAQPDEDGDVWNQQSFDFMMLIFEEGLNDLYERLGLREYNREFAKAIYANTLQQPPIFRLCTKQLVRKETRTQDGWVSENVRATLPFYKLLTAALVSLPAGFRHREQAYRGVKHVYPYLEDHRPEAHFSPGQKVVWFEAKSSSRLREVTQHTLFCGTTGPRTIFTVQEPLTGFRIEEFSSYGPDEAEARQGSVQCHAPAAGMSMQICFTISWRRRAFLCVPGRFSSHLCQSSRWFPCGRTGISRRRGAARLSSALAGLRHLAARKPLAALAKLRWMVRLSD